MEIIIIKKNILLLVLLGTMIQTTQSFSLSGSLNSILTSFKSNFISEDKYIVSCMIAGGLIAVYFARKNNILALQELKSQKAKTPASSTTPTVSRNSALFILTTNKTTNFIRTINQTPLDPTALENLWNQGRSTAASLENLWNQTSTAATENYSETSTNQVREGEV